MFKMSGEISEENRKEVDDQGQEAASAINASLDYSGDFDDILDTVGSAARYQKILLYGVLSPIVAIIPLFAMNIIFQLYEPDHWCRPGPSENSPNFMDIEAWKNETIPREIGADGRDRWSQCFMYDPADSSDAVNRSKIQCLYGWDYDRTDYVETIPSQFNWICDKKTYATNALTAGAVGAGLGTIIFGPAADKFGRKPVYLLTCVMNLVCRIISLFVVDYYEVFLIFQVLAGSAIAVMPIAPSLIVAELSGKDFRAWVYSLTWITWVIGMAILPFLAWLSGTWFNLGVVTTVPGFILLIYYWTLPESPRWLIQRGRVTEAADILWKIAQKNGKSDQLSRTKLASQLEELVQRQLKTEGPTKTTGVWTLFSKKRLAKHTILLTLCWAIDSIIYESITLNATRLSGNQFVNFFILAIIEVPSGFLGGWLANTIGRRWTQFLFFFFCTVTCFATAAAEHFYPDKDPAVVMTLIIIAKFSINLAFLVVYIQATELFPTELRSTGFGFAAMVSCGLAILGPYLVYLGTINSAAPYFLLGVVSTVGFLSSAFLPETLNQKLPETAEEADRFGHDQKFWDFRVLGRSGGGGGGDQAKISLADKENPHKENIDLTVIPM